VSEKLDKDFEIVESKKIRPKLKVINIEEEEMIFKDEKLIDTIKKQNNIDGKKGSYIRVVKRFSSGRREENMKARRENREEGSIILEIDEKTHELMCKKRKTKY